MKKPFVNFPNYAGKSGAELDAHLKDELALAGVQSGELPFTLKGEVGTCVIGALHGWTFKRAWRYWMCEGPGIPIVAASRLHSHFGNQVRVDGDCRCPSPLERFKGLGTGHYHVDSQTGLKALADTIKAVVMEANAANADNYPAKEETS